MNSQPTVIHSEDEFTLERDPDGSLWMVDHLDATVDDEGALCYVRRPAV